MITKRRNKTPIGIYFAGKSKRLNARHKQMLSYLISSLIVVKQRNNKKLTEERQKWQTRNSQKASMIFYVARASTKSIRGNMI